MSDAADLPAPPLEHTRQVTIDSLCEHFANDVLSVEEFERRVDVAHNAMGTDELRALLLDLPGGDLPAVAGTGMAATLHARRGYTLAPADEVKERGFAVAIMGGATRKGRWTPARTNFAVAIMGGAELDFREAVLGPGVTEVQVFTMWGGVDIIVPPGLNVESHGIGIMGGFDHRADGLEPDPGAPTLRISGVALMGGVDITVRHLGESARDARRRRRQERRDRLRELRDGAKEIARDAKRQLRRPGSGPL
jgi:hypothetical protein